MSNSECREWILETIDQLRKRKARPDLGRICHMVYRKYGLDWRDTEIYVEKLVDMGAVVKVDYKGNTSYRNASKWRRKSLGANVLNSNSASRRIREAIKSISKDEINQSRNKIESTSGISAREIENWITAQCEQNEEEKFMCPMHLILQREVDAGRIEKLENGNYILGSTQMKPKSMLQRQVSAVVSKRGRPPKRKFGRSFSESLVSCPRRDIAPTPVALCDYCRLSEDSNTHGVQEELLFCKDCNAKAHPSCMEYSPELAERARHTLWQCIDCKTCCICEDPGGDDSMLFCDACDKGYHMQCHHPEVLEKPSGKWVCYDCNCEGITVDDVESTCAVDSTTAEPAASNQNDNATLPTDTEYSRQTVDRLEEHTEYTKKRLKSEVTDDDTDAVFAKPSKFTITGSRYPNASKWSISDVSEFFKSIGYEEQAEAFVEQEIDGQSLLLMKRNDVLTGLSIRLGPALKIYQHVMRLQSANEAIF